MKLNKLVIALSFGASVLSATPRFHQSRLIIKIKNSLPTNSLIKSSKHFFGNYYVLRSENIQELAKQLKTTGSVESVSFDYFSGREVLPTPEKPEKIMASTKMRGNSVFNDPAVSKQWSLKSSDKHGMNVTNAYLDNRGAKTTQIIVAVVDTGVDYNHEDLKDVMWTNPGEIAGNGIDDDENGYIDDIHGINTLVRDADGNATMEIMDGHSHGTHVSGTIGAKQNNGIGIAGVASNVRIMGIRTVPNRSDETDVDVSEAFLYAARNGAKVINCSFGKSINEGGDLVKDTIDYIGREFGVLVVAAAGNSTQNIDIKLTYPASFESENLLVVASTSKWGWMSTFSNYGKRNVDIAGPGSGIYATVPGNRYSNLSGTSMASPNVAGVAAEVLSHNPELNAYELKKLLMGTVKEYRKYTKKMVSGGLVNLRDALN